MACTTCGDKHVNKIAVVNVRGKIVLINGGQGSLVFPDTPAERERADQLVRLMNGGKSSGQPFRVAEFHGEAR